jgi:hypothetical protein
MNEWPLDSGLSSGLGQGDREASFTDEVPLAIAGRNDLSEAAFTSATAASFSILTGLYRLPQ